MRRRFMCLSCVWGNLYIPTLQTRLDRAVTESDSWNNPMLSGAAHAVPLNHTRSRSMQTRARTRVQVNMTIVNGTLLEPVGSSHAKNLGTTFNLVNALGVVCTHSATLSWPCGAVGSRALGCSAGYADIRQSISAIALGSDCAAAVSRAG